MSQQKLNTKIETRIERAKSLQKSADVKLTEYLEDLRAFELDEKLWRPFYPSFDKLMDEKIEKASDRYRPWCKAQGYMPASEATIIGPSVVIEIGKVKDKAQRDEMRARLLEQANREQRHLTTQEARLTMLQVRGIKNRQDDKEKKSLLEQAQEQIAKYKRVIRNQLEQIAKLTAERDALKAALDKARAS